jgi:hypothetical protein
MRQVVANARESRETVIRSDDVNAPCRVGNGSCPASSARRPIEPGPACGRAVRPPITAAFLTTTFLATAFLVSIWTSEATAGALGVESNQASPAAEKSVQPAQAMTGDPEQLQTALDQEHHRAELVARELTAIRHLEMLLTLHQVRLESAQSRQMPENEYAELVKSLEKEREPLKQAADSGAAELCKSSPGDPAERLAQDLAVARRDVETKTALAAKAKDDASRAKQAADNSAAELRRSLQQEQERAGRLERDLAAARHDVETQTALAAKATDDASQTKQAANGGAAELRKSLQQQQERAGRLEQDLVAARRDVETQTALAVKATDEASQAKQAADSSAAELRKSLQQEQERAGRLEQDLAAARRDVQTQTTLAAKASDEASQQKQAAEKGSAELKRSLQQEREKAEVLAKELTMAHTAIYAYEAQARKASDQAADSQQATENGANGLRKSLQQEQERAARLEQDLAVARRDVETQTALVAKANDGATRSKQAAEDGSAALKRSLQKEHERAEALATSLSMVHTAIYTYEIQARITSDQAASSKQAEQSGAAELRKSLVLAWERTARLEQELVAAQRDVETQTALAAKASAEAARQKQAADDSSAESLRSLQQERDKSARLERELASARKTRDVSATSGVVTASRVTQDKPPGTDAIKPIAATQTSVVSARSNTKPDPENAAEVARLVARASVLLGQGDIGSARIVLARAAETGNAQASFALAETYDPLVLRKWGAYGTLGDAAKARDLYARAQAGGIKEARERFDALRR